MHLFKAAMSVTALMALTAPAFAQEVNLYSSRHYDSDDALYAAFTEKTGITINRIEAKADELMARMEAEGANSPADVFMTVDVGRISRAEERGLLQPFESQTIEANVPAHLRDDENLWTGLSQRARIIFYSKERVENPPRTYEDLADPAYKGQICIRSSSNIYNQSLMASIIENHGEEAAKDWAAGIVDNMAREPQGGDTDQLRGIVSGECDIAVANTYYFARGLASDVDGLTSGIDGIGWVWPNQSGRGAHVNLAAAGIAANAPNKDEATALLEYLASEEAQAQFANANNEYPVMSGVPIGEHVAKMGLFIPDNETPTASFKAHAADAQTIFNEVGWD
ncbi:iron(III) transport system substrate-binding protein [Roseovarius tolerans]|uniref:Iron(III) transport system substrate-binding protein n=1 Tax=Roseovarius tolerans TaxID=74031 RepID=A0A1H7Z2D0_9RHOB|nr:extracellular solute-binding protein [Roseovarius tolerans]SEM52476.1 iron(III) transport system substrate-binding protein [Roseovarius tolerans]